MGTTAEKLTKLSQTKSAIKSAIEAKGVTVGDVKFADYPEKIGEIQGGGGETKRFNVGIADILGEVDVNGNYVEPTDPFRLDMSSVKSFNGANLAAKFSYANVYEVDFSSLTSLNVNSRESTYSMFDTCTQLSSVKFDSLREIGGKQPFIYGNGQFMFNNCTNLRSVSFPSLSSIGGHGFWGTFIYCDRLSSIEMPNLKQFVTDGNFYQAFQRSALARLDINMTDIAANQTFCQAFNYLGGDKTTPFELHFNELTSIVDSASSVSAGNRFITYQSKIHPTYRAGFELYFHKLREINITQLFSTGSSYQFATKIHFPTGSESTIQASPGWSTQWGLGAGVAQIIFDL